MKSSMPRPTFPRIPHSILIQQQFYNRTTYPSAHEKFLNLSLTYSNNKSSKRDNQSKQTNTYFFHSTSPTQVQNQQSYHFKNTLPNSFNSSSPLNHLQKYKIVYQRIKQQRQLKSLINSIQEKPKIKIKFPKKTHKNNVKQYQRQFLCKNINEQYNYKLLKHQQALKNEQKKQINQGNVNESQEKYSLVFRNQFKKYLLRPKGSLQNHAQIQIKEDESFFNQSKNYFKQNSEQRQNIQRQRKNQGFMIKSYSREKKKLKQNYQTKQFKRTKFQQQDFGNNQYLIKKPDDKQIKLRCNNRGLDGLNQDKNNKLRLKIDIKRLL